MGGAVAGAGNYTLAYGLETDGSFSGFSGGGLWNATWRGAAAGAMNGPLMGEGGNWFTKSLLNGGMQAGYAALNGGDPTKAGLVGFATGVATTTTGPGSSLAIRMAKQAVITAGNSIGQNWAYNRSLLGKVTVGLGPVNMVFGQDATAMDWIMANRSNLVINGAGLANLAFGGNVNWDMNSLSAVYSGGAIPSGGCTGAIAVVCSDQPNDNTLSHEGVHVWDSREMGFMPFLANWTLSGTATGNNYWEQRANTFGWNAY